MLRELRAGREAPTGARPAAPSPTAAAAAVMARGEALLLEVRRVRGLLGAARNKPEVDQAERAVYAAMLSVYERGLLAALDNVLTELRKRRGEGEAEAEAWLRRRLREFRKER